MASTQTTPLALRGDKFRQRPVGLVSRTRKKEPPLGSPAHLIFIMFGCPKLCCSKHRLLLSLTILITLLLTSQQWLALANADQEEVLASWAGLGYYSRARNLHKSAKIVLSEYRGIFPTSHSELISLPGIGESTAGAILSLACNQPRPILDGNVKRVLSRYHRVAGHYSDSKVLNEFWRLAKYHTPSKQNANYTQAIMDLGATICVPHKPLCSRCPVSRHCKANICNDQESFPQKKAKTIKPEKSLAFLAYRNDKGEIYLVKRPDKGVWGGLWSFEECEDTETAITAAIKEHNLEASIVSSLPKFKHSFTHYHLMDPSNYH